MSLMARKTEITLHENDATSRKRVIDFITNLALDKKWVVTISAFKKTRSLGQNSLIHKWFGIIADETGDDAESVKEDMINRFSPRVDNKLAEGWERPKRTHEMDTAEMTDFVNRIYQLACEFNIWLPHPDDQGRNST